MYKTITIDYFAGELPPSHGRYARSASVSMPDDSTVHRKLRRTASCPTSPRTGGIEESSSSHQDETARAKTTRKYHQHFIHFTYIHTYIHTFSYTFSQDNVSKSLASRTFL